MIIETPHAEMLGKVSTDNAAIFVACESVLDGSGDPVESAKIYRVIRTNLEPIRSALSVGQRAYFDDVSQESPIWDATKMGFLAEHWIRGKSDAHYSIADSEKYDAWVASNIPQGWKSAMMDASKRVRQSMPHFIRQVFPGGWYNTSPMKTWGAGDCGSSALFHIIDEFSRPTYAKPEWGGERRWKMDTPADRREVYQTIIHDLIKEKHVWTKLNGVPTWALNEDPEWMNNAEGALMNNLERLMVRYTGEGWVKYPFENLRLREKFEIQTIARALAEIPCAAISTKDHIVVSRWGRIFDSWESKYKRVVEVHAPKSFDDQIMKSLNALVEKFGGPKDYFYK